MKNAPFYVKVAMEIRKQIAEGELLPGDCLPTELALSERLQISRSTVRKAVQHLETLGMISKMHGKKRFILGQADSDRSGQAMRTVLCIGDSGTSRYHSRFVSSGYDFLYNAMVEELQQRNICFPKVICSLGRGELPELVSHIDYQAVFLMTSTADDFRCTFRCPVVQNMERYEDNADLVIAYDSLALIRQTMHEVLALGKKRFRIFYHDINFPFLDRMYENLLRSFKLHAPDAVVAHSGCTPDGTLAVTEACALDEAVLLVAFDVRDYLDACREAGVPIPEAQLIVSFGTAGAQGMPNREHCRSFPINYRKVAKIASDTLEAILDGKRFEYNISISDWHLSQGKY